MYGYIYLTENLINFRCYIGKHKAETFDIKYKGSGTILESAFKKYGFENFISTVIQTAETEEELNNLEYY